MHKHEHANMYVQTEDISRRPLLPEKQANKYPQKAACIDLRKDIVKVIIIVEEKRKNIGRIEFESIVPL